VGFIGYVEWVGLRTYPWGGRADRCLPRLLSDARGEAAFQRDSQREPDRGKRPRQGTESRGLTRDTNSREYDLVNRPPCCVRASGLMPVSGDCGANIQKRVCDVRHLKPSILEEVRPSDSPSVVPDFLNASCEAKIILAGCLPSFRCGVVQCSWEPNRHGKHGSYGDEVAGFVGAGTASSITTRLPGKG
jgi:hypothetical protein